MGTSSKPSTIRELELQGYVVNYVEYESKIGQGFKSSTSVARDSKPGIVDDKIKSQYPSAVTYKLESITESGTELIATYTRPHKQMESGRYRVHFHQYAR